MSLTHNPIFWSSDQLYKLLLQMKETKPEGLGDVPKAAEVASSRAGLSVVLESHPGVPFGLQTETMSCCLFTCSFWWHLEDAPGVTPSVHSAEPSSSAA